MASPNSEPLFDLLSHGRKGPGRRDHLSAADIRQISRTVGRTPEVMVKVLSRGANDLKAVSKHLQYIGRKGEVDLETDTGEKAHSAHELLEDWDLELDEYRSWAGLSTTDRKHPPRLVHKVLFSMPAGTPSGKVLTAVQNFCREEFALKHRYVMALHTDEPHPHVHVLIKAINEQGERLNIRKATLRRWRADFARHLRALGVPANATQRYVRGESRPRMSDAIYRASLRGESTHLRERVEAVARELSTGHIQTEPGKAKLLESRARVRRAWAVIGSILEQDGQRDLASQTRKFADSMPPPMTGREWIARELAARAGRPRDIPRTRSL